jgi:aryl-alcohol dehydrogenase-like predicted oxidoreductase
MGHGRCATGDRQGTRKSEDEMAEIALRYILSHPAVSTVIPGMRSVRNVERNMAVGDGEGLPEDRTRRLKSHRWVRNFYA